MFSFLDKNKVPFDLSGYTPIAQIRKSTKQEVVAEFSCEILEPTTSGRLILRLGYDDTANTAPGKYMYDVLLVSTSEKLRAVEGVIDITPNITE